MNATQEDKQQAVDAEITALTQPLEQLRPKDLVARGQTMMLAAIVCHEGYPSHRISTPDEECLTNELQAALAIEEVRTWVNKLTLRGDVIGYALFLANVTDLSDAARGFLTQRILAQVMVGAEIWTVRELDYAIEAIAHTTRNVNDN